MSYVLYTIYCTVYTVHCPWYGGLAGGLRQFYTRGDRERGCRSRRRRKRRRWSRRKRRERRKGRSKRRR